MDFRTWVLADDKCSWRGVDCDAQGYVVKLYGAAPACLLRATCRSALEYDRVSFLVLH